MSESLGALLAEIALAFEPFVSVASFWHAMIMAALSLLLLALLVPAGRKADRRMYEETEWVGLERMGEFADRQ